MRFGLKKIAIHAAILLACTFGAAAPASAQSDILLRLRSGSPLGDRVRVDSAGGLVAIGELGIGIIPASGAGYRMMWYPYKAAFRAGGTDDGGAGNYWDDANVGFYSWAGGNMTISGAYGTFAFGEGTSVTGVLGTGFGDHVTVTGSRGFGSGYQSRCQLSYCFAHGYQANSGGIAAIALGYRTTADGDYSVALGHRASTNGYSGAFAWADASTTDSLEASANNQFNTRAAGGYRLYSNATTTTGVSINAGGSSWNVISDRNRKQDFVPLNGEDVLARISLLPVTRWKYIDEADRTVEHIGPMAQDFQKAFALSSDTTTINMSDLDGVNLAATQALEKRTRDLKQQLDQRDATIADLKKRLERLEALLDLRQ